MRAHRARLRNSAVGAVAVLVALGANAAPAAAHGVGGRQDLPLPIWQVAWGAGAAVVISFAALGAAWTTPRLAAAAGGRALPGAVQSAWRAASLVGRVIVTALFALTLLAAWLGSDSPAENIAPVTFYVVFWVGVPVVSALFGNIWGDIGPAAWLTSRGNPGAGAEHLGDWPASAVLGGFAWLELAYHSSSSPRAIGVFLVAYLVFLVGGAARYGPGWVKGADGFGVLFRLFGDLAPIGRDAQNRQLTLRPPFAGLARTDIRPGTMAITLVALGSTTFDGLTRTHLWETIAGNRAGWHRTVVATIGLIWTIAIVAALYLGACKVLGRLTGQDERQVANTYAPALIPIALAYAIAHYFSLLVFESQNFLIQLSDPFGKGWDLLGTAANRVDYLAVSTTTIAWVQVGAIIVGHVAGVAVSHDRAVTDHSGPMVLRSQFPLLVAMVALTVGGLLLLLGA